MKFSDIEQDKWEQLKPYVDTCLLPLTGLQGYESPAAATERLEELRDALDCLERPFHGRLVTYPAMHYTIDENNAKFVNELVRRLKESGFKYVIVLTIQSSFDKWVMDDSDLFLCVDPHMLKEKPQEIREILNKKVNQMWRPVT
jgi:23S rRNA (pseudouridine1915-N3)-methyltransferase